MSIGFITNQTCDIYAPTVQPDGKSDYSETPDFSDVPCHVEEDHTQIQDSEGNTVIVSIVIYLSSSVTIDTDYKIVVDSKNYIVIKSSPIRGIVDIDHYEVYCKGL